MADSIRKERKKKNSANHAILITETMKKEIKDFCENNYMGKTKLIELALAEYLHEYNNK